MDVDVHGPGSDLSGRLPGEGDQLVAGERSAGVAGQGGKQLELSWAEVDGASVMSKSAPDDIEVESVGHGQLRLDVDHRPIVRLEG